MYADEERLEAYADNETLDIDRRERLRRAIQEEEDGNS